MTREQLKRVHIALEQTGGNISQAAALLGLSFSSLKTIIKNNPDLESYFNGCQPPAEGETLARPALAITKEELAVVEGVKKADEQVRDGFAAIGVTGQALEQAMAFKEFGRLHFQSIRHYIGGGVAKLFADLMGDVNKTREDIEDPSIKMDVEMQRMLREDRSRLVKMCLEAYDRTREAAMTAAVIEQKKQEQKLASKKARPAFAPLAMQVNGNVTVQEGGGKHAEVQAEERKVQVV